MTADLLPVDGTVVRAKAGMPGVDPGTRAVVRHVSPGGLSNVKSGLVWLELDSPIVWSHGVSDRVGYWAAPCEFEVDEVDHHWRGMPDPHRHNPFAVAVVLVAFLVVLAGCGVLVVEAITRGLW